MNKTDKEKLQELEYRHNCLKSLYEEAMANKSGRWGVETEIDEFIRQEQTHS